MDFISLCSKFCFYYNYDTIACNKNRSLTYIVSREKCGSTNEEKVHINFLHAQKGSQATQMNSIYEVGELVALFLAVSLHYFFNKVVSHSGNFKIMWKICTECILTFCKKTHSSFLEKPWTFFWLNGYLGYKTITSQHVSSETQVLRIFLFHRKVMFHPKEFLSSILKFFYY